VESAERSAEMSLGKPSKIEPACGTVPSTPSGEEVEGVLGVATRVVSPLAPLHPVLLAILAARPTHTSAGALAKARQEIAEHDAVCSESERHNDLGGAGSTGASG